MLRMRPLLLLLMLLFSRPRRRTHVPTRSCHSPPRGQEIFDEEEETEEEEPHDYREIHDLDEDEDTSDDGTTR
jgi:hypothetical protein